MRVPCTITYDDIENHEACDGYTPGVIATCSRCGHSTESCGESGASVRRCLALMREECPEGESNFYTEDEE